MTELPATATMTTFAKLHGVTRAAVYKWKASGHLVFAPDGKVDVSASNARLDARPDVYRGGRKRTGAPAETAPAPPVSASESEAMEVSARDPSSWSTAEAIRRKEIASALLRQIEADTAAGRVIPVSDAEEIWFGFARAVQSGGLSLPGRIAFEVPTMSVRDRSTVERIVGDWLTDLALHRGKISKPGTGGEAPQ